MPDPTMEFLRRLSDPSKWEVRESIPIFKPHRRAVKLPDGSDGEIVVTESDLPEIARNMRALLERDGVAGRITPGHVRQFDKDGNPVKEEDQPPLYGFYKNPRVGRYGPKNELGVLVDAYYFPEHAPAADRFPYRSAEYYHGSKVIRGLALLVRDPFLDMGVVTYDRSRDQALNYAMESDMPAAPMGADNGGAPEKVEGDKKPDDWKPEERDLFEKCCRYLRTTYGLDSEWPKQKAAAPEEKVAPDAAKDKVEEAIAPPDKKAEEVTPMEKDKIPELYEKKLAEIRTDYEAKLAAAVARIDGINLERDHERCSALLYSLETEGFALSPDEKQKELAKLVKIPAGERADRVKELRAIYAERRVPEGRLELYQGPVEGGGPDESNPGKAPWYHNAALNYMRANPGTQYEKACEVVQAAGKK